MPAPDIVPQEPQAAGNTRVPADARGKVRSRTPFAPPVPERRKTPKGARLKNKSGGLNATRFYHIRIKRCQIEGVRE